LVFSPVRLSEFSPRGGAVYCGQILGKDEQLRRLASIGILTPKTEVLSSPSSFDPDEWGEYVIVKPCNFNSGRGVKLVRTVDLAARYEELTAIANDQFIVEPYIDHAEDGYPAEYRVLSLFGRALYCARNQWGDKRPPLAEIADDPLGVIASNTITMGGRVRSICHDPEIVSLGERAHEAFPECPLIGVDIIRESQSGRLYVLEVNPHGSVWHFSSTLSKKMEPEHVRDLYAQFNALDLAADLLIQKTRAEAC
jgi:glutathione synthase/RimK-type ligase-like ATP-grasp enzyme